MYLVISEKDAVLWKLQAGLECYCGILDSCHYYHLSLRGEGRFLRKTKFPPLGVTEKYVTFFDILRKISTQPPMILAIRGATALLLY